MRILSTYQLSKTEFRRNTLDYIFEDSIFHHGRMSNCNEYWPTSYFKLDEIIFAIQVEFVGFFQGSRLREKKLESLLYFYHGLERKCRNGI